MIDGDTLEIDGALIQLYGIDAPELGQMCERGGKLWPCGLDAALALKKMLSLQGPPVRCAPWAEGAGTGTSMQASIQVCQIGDKNLALTMVRNGYSVVLPDSTPDYIEAEKQARTAKLGLWQGDFVPPWDWRKGRQAEARAADWVRNCNVKGAVMSDGSRVFYVPTDDQYQDVTVEPGRGEQTFCSDEEARAAGWTRPGGAG